MYVGTGCFDPNSMTEGPDDGFSLTVPNSNPLPPPMAGSTTNSHNSFEENLKVSMEELSYQHPPQEDASADTTTVVMEMELQQQLAFNMENSYNNNNNNTQLMQQVIHESNQVLSCDQSNWDTHVREMQDIGFNHHQQEQLLQQVELQDGHHGFNISASLQETTYPPTPDLLNLFHLPRCSATSLLPDSSISFANPTYKLGFIGDLPTADSSSGLSSVLYDPLLHLNLPQQPPLFRELFQSLPRGYCLPASRGSLFGGGDDQLRDGNGVVYQDGDGGQFDNGILEFTRDISCKGKGRESGKKTTHFTTERERRNHLNDKYRALRSLVPNPTKADRASVVGDAIDYIKELLRTVNELKLLVEKKRCGRERSKRHKTEEDAAGDVESCNMKPLGDPDQSYNGSLRSSWLQRKSKDAEVDVRIIDDEVTIKLVQRKINCLLSVSKVLDELQLDLHHVAGGHIGDHYSFLFSTKIYEGSSLYAGAIANKLIEVADGQYAAVPPTSSY